MTPFAGIFSGQNPLPTLRTPPARRISGQFRQSEVCRLNSKILRFHTGSRRIRPCRAPNRCHRKQPEFCRQTARICPSRPAADAPKAALQPRLGNDISRSTAGPPPRDQGHGAGKPGLPGGSEPPAARPPKHPAGAHFQAFKPLPAALGREVFAFPGGKNFPSDRKQIPFRGAKSSFPGPVPGSAEAPFRRLIRIRKGHFLPPEGNILPLGREVFRPEGTFLPSGREKSALSRARRRAGAGADRRVESGSSSPIDSSALP